MYVTCTCTYAHKKPTPKPKHLKPCLKDKLRDNARGKPLSLTKDGIDEGDVVWQDDPEYESKMAKLYPDKVVLGQSFVVFVYLYFYCRKKSTRRKSTMRKREMRKREMWMNT